jgi:hypothetical protein
LVLALLTWTAISIARGVARENGSARIRLLGLAVFVTTATCYAAALGWGRAAVVRYVYHFWPTRYMLLVVPLFCGIYLVWEVYGLAWQRATVQTVMFVVILVMTPFNTAHGLQAAQWYSDNFRAVTADLNCSISQFARRHRDYLNHAATEDTLKDQIKMLKDAGRWPFTQLTDDTPPALQQTAKISLAPQEATERRITYNLPGATDAILVWGVNGWQKMNGAKLPADTWVENGLMHTVMTGSNGRFSAGVRAPANATVEFGFLARDRVRNPAMQNIWEAADRVATTPRADIEITSKFQFDEDGPFRKPDRPLIRKTVRYRSTQASEVFLLWGTDDWYPVVRELRPPGTDLRGNRMYSPMTRRGDTFETYINVPVGGKMNCIFFITARRGIEDLIKPIWDTSCADGSGDAGIDVISKVSLTPEFLEFVPTQRECLSAVGAVFAGWLVFLALFTGMRTRFPRTATSPDKCQV